MPTFCYCNRIDPANIAYVAQRKEQKKHTWTPQTYKEQQKLDEATGMSQFALFLQQSPFGAFSLHAFTAPSLEQVFQGLRDMIQAQNAAAIDLWKFYQTAFSIDYRLESAMPQIEQVFILEDPSSAQAVSYQAFCLPLISEMEQEYRAVRQASMHAQRPRHLSSMQAFHTRKITSWIQSTQNQKYIVTLTESSRTEFDPSATSHHAYQAICDELAPFTTLPKEQLMPVSERIL